MNPPAPLRPQSSWSWRLHPLDNLITMEALVSAQMERLSPAQAEETERMGHRVCADKAALSRELNALESRIQQA